MASYVTQRVKIETYRPKSIGIEPEVVLVASAKDSGIVVGDFAENIASRKLCTSATQLSFHNLDYSVKTTKCFCCHSRQKHILHNIR